MMGSSPDLVAVHVEVRFGAFKALDDVSLRLGPGEIVGLIGPNGSGKTTLLNALSGVVRPSEGRVTVGDRTLPPRAEGAARAGIARTFQNLRLFRELTVRENVEVALSTRRRAPFSRVRSAEALAYLREVGMEDAAERKARTLAYGDQRRLEIARALALEPTFLLLDEPAAGMLPNESAALVDALQRIHRGRRLGLLVIDHDLRLITRLCQRVIVLDAGRAIAAGTPQQVQESDAVIAAYLGRNARRARSFAPGREAAPSAVPKEGIA